MTPTDKFRQFIKERDEALRSLDVDKVREFFLKWSPPKSRSVYAKTLPSAEVQEIGMHKARTGCLDLTKEERQFSKDWLTQRGYKSLDDGDLE